jgi:hypothetical protein
MTTRFRHLAAKVILPLLLGACTLQPPVTAPAAAVQALPKTPLEHVSSYQSWLDELSPEALAAESLRVPENPPEVAGKFERVLLMGKRHGTEDLAQALAMLDAINADTSGDVRPWQPVAKLLERSYRADYMEQKRLQEQLDKQGQQLRDSQRRNEQLNEKVEQLGHKLDALKSIELNLPKPASSGSPAPALPNPPVSAPAAAMPPRSPAS